MNDNLGRPKTSHEYGKGFVKKFLESSRLSFIGRWRTRFLKILEDLNVDYDDTNVYKSTPSSNSSVVLHCDLDAFFCSVTIRDNPKLKNKPVAICHSSGDNAQYSEISTCNYIARSKGIRSNMSISKAKLLCEDLVTMPFDFVKYEQAGELFYKCLFKVTRKVLSVSCDEAYLDITDVVNRNLTADINNFSPEEDDETQTAASQHKEEVISSIAEKLRLDIFDAIKITASCGVASNRFLAKLATNKAKPNGVYIISPRNLDLVLNSMSLSDIPSIGYRNKKKLSSSNVNSIRELRQQSLEWLKKFFGNVIGLGVYKYLRGIDNREWNYDKLIRQSTVGVQLSWGVRMESNHEVYDFIDEVNEEVCQRLNQLKVIGGKTVKLTLWKARQDNDASRKGQIGHGRCTVVTKSKATEQAVHTKEKLTELAYNLFQQLQVAATDIRGLGVTLSDLVYQQQPTSSSIASLFQQQAKPKQKTRKAEASTPPSAKRTKLSQELIDLAEVDVEKQKQIFQQYRNELTADETTLKKQQEIYETIKKSVNQLNQQQQQQQVVDGEEHTQQRKPEYASPIQSQVDLVIPKHTFDSRVEKFESPDDCRLLAQSFLRAIFERRNCRECSRSLQHHCFMARQKDCLELCEVVFDYCKLRKILDQSWESIIVATTADLDRYNPNYFLKEHRDIDRQYWYGFLKTRFGVIKKLLES